MTVTGKLVACWQTTAAVTASAGLPVSRSAGLPAGRRGQTSRCGNGAGCSEVSKGGGGETTVVEPVEFDSY